MGTVVANLMFELPAIDFASTERSSAALWLSEVVATVGLLLVIHGCVRTGRSAAVPYAVRFWIGGAYWFTSSTSFANPAVTIARMLSGTLAGIEPGSAPMFIVMQTLGAAIAFVLIRYLYRSIPWVQSSTSQPRAREVDARLVVAIGAAPLPSGVARRTTLDGRRREREMGMNQHRVQTVALVALVVAAAPVGLQAAFGPRSFYDDFPFGRGWIRADGGAYNEHLVRDVGAFFLAMAVLTAWAVRRRAMALPIGVAWIVQGVLHLWYHLGNLDGLDGADRVGMVVSLFTFPLLACIVLVTERSEIR